VALGFAQKRGQTPDPLRLQSRCSRSAGGQSPFLCKAVGLDIEVGLAIFAGLFAPGKQCTKKGTDPGPVATSKRVFTCGRGSVPVFVECGSVELCTKRGTKKGTDP